jgi:hypothetical protein
MKHFASPNAGLRFVVNRLMEELRQSGPRLCPNSEPTSLSKSADGITITLKNGSTQGPFDQALSLCLTQCQIVTSCPGALGCRAHACHSALESCRCWRRHRRVRPHTRRRLREHERAWRVRLASLITTARSTSMSLCTQIRHRRRGRGWLGADARRHRCRQTPG